MLTHSYYSALTNITLNTGVSRFKKVIMMKCCLEQLNCCCLYYTLKTKQLFLIIPNRPGWQAYLMTHTILVKLDSATSAPLISAQLSRLKRSMFTASAAFCPTPPWRKRAANLMQNFWTQCQTLSGMKLIPTIVTMYRLTLNTEEPFQMVFQLGQRFLCCCPPENESYNCGFFFLFFLSFLFSSFMTGFSSVLFAQLCLCST